MAIMIRIIILLFLMINTAVYCSPLKIASGNGTLSVSAPATPIASNSLEREKFGYQKALEERKLEVERLKAWLTGGSILIPLLLGFMTLAWQTWTSAKQKERDAKDSFELKAADIALSGNSPTGTKNKARLLAALFPNRLPKGFGDAFDPKDYTAPSTDVRIEVFKMASTKVESASEVGELWHKLFPGDKWIEPLLPNPSLQGTPTDNPLHPK